MYSIKLKEGLINDERIPVVVGVGRFRRWADAVLCIYGRIAVELTTNSLVVRG